MPTYRGPDKRWRFRGVVNGQKYSGSSPKGDNTKRAAEHAETELIRKLQARVFTGTMPTVREFAERFLEFQRARTREGTHLGQERHLKLHVVPHIGHKQLDAVEQRDIDMLVTRWKKSAGVRTVNLRLSTVTRMFAVAVEWRMIAAAPSASALKVPEDTIRFLTEAEAAAMLEKAPPQWRSMMFIGLRTGLRVGELRGLQWGDVDLVRSQLHVRRTDPGVPGRDPGPPKGGKSRTVPLTPDASITLRDIKPENMTATSWVWPGLWGKRRDGTRSEAGCVAAIAATLDAAGIVDGPGERLGWHTLRHTFASWLVIRGVSLRVVQALLGHASIRQTERYAHLAPNATHHDAVSSLDFALAGPGSIPQRALKDPSDTDPE